MRALFITGTDTGVGKTLVTALLASGLRRRGIDAGVMKPVASGCGDTARGLMSPDALFFERILGRLDPAELVNPVRYRAPLAPSVAAGREGRTLDLAALDAAFESMTRRHRILLVEGVGGLLVPLEGKFTVADLALRWRIPLLVVARPGLGTINHAALAILHARSRGIPVEGFVFNASRPGEDGEMLRDNAACIGELCGVPFLGSIPWGGDDPCAPDAWERLVIAADGISETLMRDPKSPTGSFPSPLEGEG
ncbi:MAG: dethiobiotin synthase [Chlamydiota bacterium]